MKMKKVLILLATMVLALALLASCGKKEEEKGVIKLGVRDSQDQVDVCMDALEKAGYKVEVTVFDDSIQPNVALAEGSIDINWYQHEPYLNAYNADNGTKLVMIEPKTAAPLFAMYSTKIKDVKELKDGATIAICADASNKARGLHLLESQGLIKIKDGVETPTQYDIAENPHNFKFIEADMQVLPQSLPDVDCILCAAAHMVNAGLDGTKYVCASDDAEEYAVGFVVREEDKDASWATGLAKAVQCDALAEYYATVKQGVMVPMWK
ncbi:MAG: metal ABC transporter substrate-binding protein [Mogibacterium sp.]|nr:metal ABC transporter substrate-binding protein [Mogibacterium sp.]